MERIFTGMARAVVLCSATALILLLAACPNPANDDPKQYTITFDSHEGTAVTAITADEGTAVAKPADPTRNAYAFLGWFSAASGGTAYVWPHTLSADITMHAHWEPVPQHTITFNTHGGTAVTAITANEGTAVAKPADPTRNAYNFTGWYDAASEGTAYTWPHTLDANVTMHAQWEPVPRHTLTFNSHEGTTVSPIMANEGTAIPKPTDPTRSGYSFAGWHDAETGGVLYAWPYTLDADVTMHAQWIPRRTLTFDSHSGTPVSAITANEGEEVAKPNDPTRNGYTFLGWFNAASGGTLYAWPHTLSADVTMHAQWQDNSLPPPERYTLTFDSHGGTLVTAITANEGTELAKPTTDPVLTGHTFNGWFAAETGGTAYAWPHILTANITLHAQWTPITYTVAYNANGGAGTTASGTHTYGVAKTLTTNGFARTGYVFAGWTAQANGGGDSYTNGQSVTNLAVTQDATITLYAQWTPITYTVAYNANGGTGTMASSSHTYDVEKALTLNEFAKTGDAFIGWNTQADGDGDSYTNGQSVSNLTATAGVTVTLYAQWSVSYSIAYVLNGANPTNNPTVYTVESLPLTLAPPARTGQAGSWFDNEGLSGAAVTAIPVGSTGNKTYYAGSWTVVTYNITYILNGGTNAASNPATYDFEDATINLAAPARSGYTFGGWYENSGFTVPAATIPAGSTGNKTFYAKWNEGTARVTISYWVNQQGQISSAASSATVSKTGNPQIIAADGAGYSDQHWYINGVEDISQTGQASYSFSGTGKDTKTYTIGLRVKKDNQYYSTQFTVTVTD